MKKSNKKKTEHDVSCDCANCGRKAEFFRSKCCMANLEGVVLEDGRLGVVCIKCKKFVSMLYDPLTDITAHDAKLILEYIDWLQRMVDESVPMNEALNKVRIVYEVINKLAKLSSPTSNATGVTEKT